MQENAIEEIGISHENQEAIADVEKLEGNKVSAIDEEVGKEGSEIVATEHIVDEQIEEEQGEGEHAKDEKTEGKGLEGEYVEYEENEKDRDKGEELEQLKVEHAEGEQVNVSEKKEEAPPVEEQVEEEEAYVEEPPPDPSAPYDLTDSKEALREPFELRPDQLAEVEQLWDLYQNYTPVYTDINGYITEKELVYMLKALLLMTYTPEQLQELIAFCVRPPHPEGHISYDQFLKMVIIRQRDFPIEDELRSALQVLDPDRTGSMDREQLKDLLATKGHKLTDKQLNNLMKEVDISNDGTIGVEDVVGTMCIDLNKEDIQMLLASLNPNPPDNPPEDQF